MYFLPALLPSILFHAHLHLPITASGKKHFPLIRIFCDNTLRPPPRPTIQFPLPNVYHVNDRDMHPLRSHTRYLLHLPGRGMALFIWSFIFIYFGCSFWTLVFLCGSIVELRLDG